MSITRLQQARQMYAMGQRVGRIAFGGGGSHVSGDGAGKYQGGSGAPGSAEAGKSSYSSPSDHGGTGNDPGGYVSKTNPTGTLTGADYERARRDYEVGVAGGYAKDKRHKDSTGHLYQNFLDYKPEFKPLPTLGPFSVLTNVLNKPIQKFSDFTTSKNRDFFMNEVVRAGKIPNVNYGTIAEMTSAELEEAYQNYLSNRLSGETDAYGNLIVGNEGDGSNQGIATLYNAYDMFDDSSVDENMKVANDPFIFRYAGQDNTLNPGAAGVDSVAELRDLQQQRGENIYT